MVGDDGGFSIADHEVDLLIIGLLGLRSKIPMIFIIWKVLK